MRGIRGIDSTPFHRWLIGGGVDGRVYDRFLRDRIDVIVYNGSIERPILASAMSEGARIVELGPFYSDPRTPQILRIASLIHEARHLDPRGSYKHVDCPERDLDHNLIRGSVSLMSLTGVPGCDVTDEGAYATEAEFLYNIAAYCTNCTEEIKAEAYYYSVDVLRRIIEPHSRNRLATDMWNAYLANE